MKKKSHKKLIIFIVLGLFVLLCIGFFTPRLIHDFNSVKIERVSTGGFSGAGDGYNFKLQGQTLTLNKKKISVSQIFITEVNYQLDRMSFQTYKKSYNKNECCDMFSTTYTISKGFYKKSVTFVSFGSDKVPDRLIEFDERLIELIKIYEKIY